MRWRVKVYGRDSRGRLEFVAIPPKNFPIGAIFALSLKDSLRKIKKFSKKYGGNR